MRLRRSNGMDSYLVGPRLISPSIRSFKSFLCSALRARRLQASKTIGAILPIINIQGCFSPSMMVTFHPTSMAAFSMLFAHPLMTSTACAICCVHRIAHGWPSVDGPNAGSSNCSCSNAFDGCAGHPAFGLPHGFPLLFSFALRARSSMGLTEHRASPLPDRSVPSA